MPKKFAYVPKRFAGIRQRDLLRYRRDKNVRECDFEGESFMLGDRLMELRKKHGYSQQEIADILSVSRQTISNWESGQGAPALDKACELARIYKISLDELVGNEVRGVAEKQKEKVWGTGACRWFPRLLLRHFLRSETCCLPRRRQLHQRAFLKLREMQCRQFIQMW